MSGFSGAGFDLDTDAINDDGGASTSASASTLRSFATSAELLAELDHLKKQGNEEFKAGGHAAAIRHYDEALALARHAEHGTVSAEAVLLSNRAACRLALKEWALAEADAGAAVKLDPSFAKGYYRLSTAQHEAGDLAKALVRTSPLLTTSPPPLPPPPTAPHRPPPPCHPSPPRQRWPRGRPQWRRVSGQTSRSTRGG